MGKLLIILFTPPIHSENTDTVYELAKAARQKGHEVTVFFDADATYNLMVTKVHDVGTHMSKMAQLIDLGVKALICGESARLRGIDLEANLLKGAVRSSLGKLAELTEQNDRILAFG